MSLWGKQNCDIRSQNSEFSWDAPKDDSGLVSDPKLLPAYNLYWKKHRQFKMIERYLTAVTKVTNVYLGTCCVW